MKTLAQIHGLVRPVPRNGPHCVIEGPMLATDRKGSAKRAPTSREPRLSLRSGLIVFALCAAERSHTIAPVLS